MHTRTRHGAATRALAAAGIGLLLTVRAATAVEAPADGSRADASPADTSPRGPAVSDTAPAPLPPPREDVTPAILRHDTPDTGEPYYFYRALPYGSEALVNPLRVIINGGFGITSFDNRDNRLSAIHWKTGWRNTWKNLSDPIGAIEANGWGDFLEREVLPLSVSTKKAHYWPNYTLHVVGGGMSYRLCAEWLRYHGYPYPKTLSVASMVAYHMINEVVENDDFEGYSTDAVADIYIFDPLGILLFSWDPVARFFSQTLHMAEWSYQAAIDPETGALQNHGQNFALKYRLGGSKWSLFYHMGTHGELGFSYRQDDGDAFSFGFGGQAKDIWELGEGVRSLDLVPSAGFFYDRNNSLMASLILSRREDERLRVNLYPGLLRFGPFTPGFFAGVDGDGIGGFGVLLDPTPLLPLGLATGF